VSEKEHDTQVSVRGVGGTLRTLGRMLAEGQAGSLLVILMIAVIWIFFQVMNANFLSAANLTNLMLQNVAVATIWARSTSPWDRSADSAPRCWRC
jgi:hypothetical protein